MASTIGVSNNHAPFALQLVVYPKKVASFIPIQKRALSYSYRNGVRFGGLLFFCLILSLRINLLHFEAVWQFFVVGWAAVVFYLDVLCSLRLPLLFLSSDYFFFSSWFSRGMQMVHAAIYWRLPRCRPTRRLTLSCSHPAQHHLSFKLWNRVEENVWYDSELTNSICIQRPAFVANLLSGFIKTRELSFIKRVCLQEGASAALGHNIYNILSDFDKFVV